jgi:hypothetical protein
MMIFILNEKNRNIKITILLMTNAISMCLQYALSKYIIKNINVST